MKTGNTSAKSAGTIVLYVAAAIVFLVGVATLVLNIMNYNSIVESYVAQGYPAEMVTKQLLTGTLLPQVFEAVGLYFGIACALFGLGMINKKVSLNTIAQDDAIIAPIAMDSAFETRTESSVIPTSEENNSEE